MYVLVFFIVFIMQAPNSIPTVEVNAYISFIRAGEYIDGPGVTIFALRGSINHASYGSSQSASAGLSNNLFRSSTAVIFNPVIFINESNRQFPLGDGMSLTI